MKVALGSDHRGHDICRHLAQWLLQQEYSVIELGPSHEGPSDYPDAAWLVARSVAKGECERGILVDGTGIGMSIAANKVAGARAALVHDEIGAEISRRHSDANILCLPADMLGERIIDRLVRTWLITEFDTSTRHARRVAKINAIESGGDPTGVGDSAAVSES